MYLRIFTMRAERVEGADNSTYEKARKLALVGELEVCNHIARGVEQLLGLVSGTIGEDEILIDIPRRLLEDSVGKVYMVRESGAVHALEDLSAPARDVRASYARMTNSIRCFVSPRVNNLFVDKYGGAYINDIRSPMQQIVVSSFKDVRADGQIR
jgi:hypothetical protein